MPSGGHDEKLVLELAVERDEAAMKTWLMCAGVDDDALVVIVDAEREVAVVVAAVLVDEDCNAGCSADPCSGDDVGDACSVYLPAEDDFSVPG